MKHVKTPIINPVVVLRKEFDDWAVLFNPDTAEAVGINPLGVTIWEQLVKNKSISDIVGFIQDEYREAPKNVHDEVNTFIHTLAERGFIGYEINSGD